MQAQGTLPSTAHSGGGHGAGSMDDTLANPALPDDILREAVGCPLAPCPELPTACQTSQGPTVQALEGCPQTCWPGWFGLWAGHAQPAGAAQVPGNIRRAEHFVQFLRRFLEYMRRRMGTQAVEQETPAAFLASLQEAMSIDGGLAWAGPAVWIDAPPLVMRECRLHHREAPAAAPVEIGRRWLGTAASSLVPASCQAGRRLGCPARELSVRTCAADAAIRC